MKVIKKPWKEDWPVCLEMLEQGCSVVVIAYHLGRTESSVSNKLNSMGYRKRYGAGGRITNQVNVTLESVLYRASMRRCKEMRTSLPGYIRHLLHRDTGTPLTTFKLPEERRVERLRQRREQYRRRKLLLSLSS